MNVFWHGYAWPTILTAIEVLCVAVPLLVAIAYYTYFERKVLAFSQLRKGPNVVGPFGISASRAPACHLRPFSTAVARVLTTGHNHNKIGQ